MNFNQLSSPSWLANKYIILGLYLALAIFASTQSLLLGPKEYNPSAIYPTHYNNYTIFKQSHFHLVNNQDLYVEYPAEHWDLFKYTPTFALLFGAFAYFPDTIGLTLWNLLNAIVLVLSIYSLPRLNRIQQSLMLLACAIELTTSMQNEQSNALIAGLLIFSFTLCEKGKFIWAAGCIILATFIKPFAIVGLALLLFYPRKVRHIDNGILWSLVLLLLPLIIVTPGQLILLYKGWLHVLAEDQSSKLGLSVAGWLNSWFQFVPDKKLLLGAGAVLFMLPYMRFKMYTNYQFKLWAVAAMLIWVVIFNHMAESPTFIIAIAGASIWFFSKSASVLDFILFILVFISVSISPTDIIPHDIRDNYVRPYVLKVVPCILLWLRIIVDMMMLRKSEPETLVVQPT